MVPLRLFRPATVSGGEHLSDSGDDFLRGEFDGVCFDRAALCPAPAPPGRSASFTSGLLFAARSFTHVGLHWAAETPPGAALSFEVRTSAEGSAWSSWSPIGVHTPPGTTPSGDTFGNLVYAPGARFIQYRASFSGEPRLLRVSAEAIDSPPAAPAASARIGGPGAFRAVIPQLAADDFPAPAAPGDPQAYDPATRRSLAVIPREAWGADESIRFRDDGTEIWHEMFIPARKLIVHHTATRNSYESFEQAAAEVRAVYQYHAVGHGWGDIGYTALVDRFGNVYEGRHGRGGDAGDSLAPRELLSAGVSGGHTKEYEYGSAGVALLGDAEAADWEMFEPSGPMWDALVRFAVFECGRSFLPPLAPGAFAAGSDAPAVSDFLRTDGEWHESAPNIGGHIDFSETSCPGEPVIALLPALRRAIHEGLAATSRTGVTLWNDPPGSRQAAPGEPVTWEWFADALEDGWSLSGFEYSIEGWFKPGDSDDVTYLSGYTNERQPRLAFASAPPGESSVTFVPASPGQYTIHVRAVITREGAAGRAAFEGSQTVAVGAPPGEAATGP